MTETNKTYRVNLISDAPASEDDFGPHNRLAGAIVNLIKTEQGGKTIALEGGWGSGKSTVVNLIRTKIDEFADKENYTFILFDAWAHEGDPLRRTFLETLIHHFLQLKWIEKVNRDRKIRNWNEKLEELARRKTITRQKTLPDFGLLEYLVAFTILLIPIGFVIFNAWVSEPSRTLPRSSWQGRIFKYRYGFLVYSLYVVRYGYSWRILLFRGEGKEGNLTEKSSSAKLVACSPKTVRLKTPLP